MLSIRDVVKAVVDNDGYTFGASQLKMSLEDFQQVAVAVKEAEMNGYIDVRIWHKSGSVVGFDCIVVEGATDAGREFLDRG
ncbi:MAG: hypothetical protein H6831_08805 [Planctomycetes bacterium]|nr:hypothetical protein [Planctomycetota bacterium]